MTSPLPHVTLEALFDMLHAPLPRSDRPVRICIIDMNAGVENQAIRCLYGIIDLFREIIEAENPGLGVLTTRVSPRNREEKVPRGCDLYLSSGGPGSPFEGEGQAWLSDYFGFLDEVLNAEVKSPGAHGGAFLICYSFELAIWKFGLARLPARVGKKFGVMPVYPTHEGQRHPIFERFGDRFFAFEHRNWEAVDTDERALRSLGGEILARESRIGRSDKGDAILALHLGPAIEAVQFHPEGDREGILAWVRKPEQAAAIRETYGDETHDRMLRSLTRPERIERVYREMVPAWMLRVFNRLALHRGWKPVAHTFPTPDELKTAGRASTIPPPEPV